MEVGHLFLHFCVQDQFNHSTPQICFLDLSITCEWMHAVIFVRLKSFSTSLIFSAFPSATYFCEHITVVVSMLLESNKK